MKAKTEELLYFLLWSAEKLMRPTFRNLTDSYESWAYRNGLIRQISTLERNRFLEAGESGSDARLYRLTDEGRLRALGGRDPEICWGDHGTASGVSCFLMSQWPATAIGSECDVISTI